MSQPFLSATFNEPVWRGTTVAGGLYLGDASYSHEIRAFGGYWAASLTQGMSRNALDGWIQDGLGRDVTIYDDSLTVCWQGFVNSVTAQARGEIIQVGPFLDVANRMAVTYTPLVPITDPPQRLEQTTTAVANNTASQALWGIQSSVFAGGELTDAAALQVRDMLLQERALPRTTRTLATSAGQTLTLDMLGYAHLLRYPYNQTTTLGYSNLSAKLQAVIAADPNATFSTDYTRITANTLQVPAYENQGAAALDLIQEMVQEGDASLNRYLFGVYDGRRAIYEAAPTTTGYVEVAGDYGRRIYTPAQLEVKPWNVRPGRWLLHAGFLIGGQDPSSLSNDGRFEFLETVSYTAPRGLEYESGRSATINMILAQRGLAGVYA